jgi:hypothetical protein
MLVAGLLAVLALLLPAPCAAGADESADPRIDALSQKLNQCAEDDFEALTEIARWAVEQHLFPQADQLCRYILARDAEHEGAYALLQQVAMAQTLPDESAALEDARSLLPDDFHVHETTRYVVLTDVSTAWAQHHAQMLERTHHQFLRFCRRLDLKPLPLRHKLVAVLFEDRAMYQAFARQHDHVRTPSIAGYYAPLRDRLVFYQVDANPSLTEARQKLDTMQDELRDIEKRQREARRAGRREEAKALEDYLDDARALLRAEEDRLEDFADRTGTATTLHEAAHQLLFHTGVQNPAVEYPIWISEGLATGFETDEPHAAFGPDHDYAGRRDHFDELAAADDLLPLRELVTITSIDATNSANVDRIYHQSYSLVRWMTRTRKQQLRAYLMRMRDQPPGKLSAQQHVVIFEDAFGPIDRVERAWRRD